MPEPPRVRLQLTIDRTSAERLAVLAERMGRSQSWLAAELLAETLSNRKKVTEWASVRLAAALAAPFSPSHGPSGEGVSVQTLVTPETAAGVERVAAGLNQSVAKAGAWLLENGLNDHGWIIQFVTSTAGRKVMTALTAVIDSWWPGEAASRPAEA